MVQQAARAAQAGPLNTRRKSTSITPGEVLSLATVDHDFVFAEAAIGDIASVSFNTAPVAGIVVGAPYVAVAGHVRIPFANITAGPLTQVAIVANVSIQK
jgi:hypothetical protein